MMMNFGTIFLTWFYSCQLPIWAIIQTATDIRSSVVEQPFKIPFAAAIIVVANPESPDLAREALARAASNLNKYFKSGLWREVKLVLRFLACLQGILEGDGVFPILEELFSRAVDLQTASSEDVSKISKKVFQR